MQIIIKNLAANTEVARFDYSREKLAEVKETYGDRHYDILVKCA